MSRKTDLSSAERCRVNGWHVGDCLEGYEEGVLSRIIITAIGEESILAKCIQPMKRLESTWSLALRDWKKVYP